MPHYLIQWSYKAPQVKALVEAPQDRPAMVRKVVEAFGGRLHDFYFAFGDYDGAFIVEFPDNESCAACMMTIDAAGGSETLKTTVLITPEEGFAAMTRAKAAVHGYTAPVGYSSHG